MTNWTIRGRKRHTGKTDTIQITAASEQAARQAAHAEGIDVESITPSGLKAARPTARPTHRGALDSVGAGIAVTGLIVVALGLLAAVAGLVMGDERATISGVSAVSGGLVLWIIGAVLSRIDRAASGRTRAR